MDASSGFAGRLAYVRWLRNRGRILPETDRQLAAALGVGEKWLAKWKTRAAAPEGRKEAEAIGAALAGMGVGIPWLYDGKGEPPEPDMWAVWVGRQQRAAAAPKTNKELKERYGLEEPPGPPKKEKAAKKAAGDKRRA